MLRPPADSAPATQRLPDLEKLLAPISVDRPAGQWLRYESIYDEIREARREDDASLPQGVWKTEPKKADWPRVERLCLEALEQKSKDLQLAAWLAEAWTWRFGVAGAEHGMRLLFALAESFWPDLHPRPDGSDLEARLAPFEWLDGRLSQAIKAVVVTRPETEDGESLRWLDWEAARHRAQIARVKGATNTEVETSRFTVATSLTPTAFYRELDARLSAASAATSELANLLEQRCGREAPRFLELRETIDTIDRYARGVLRQRSSEEETPMPAPARSSGEIQLVAVDPASETESGLPAGGPIRSRAEAYRRLSEAAEYLARTEPHSPTPYLVRRAVAWGSMTVTELLRELLADKADLPTVFKLLGIQDESGKTR